MRNKSGNLIQSLAVVDERLKIIFPLFTTLLHFSLRVIRLKTASSPTVIELTASRESSCRFFHSNSWELMRRIEGNSEFLLSHHQNTTTFHDNFSFFFTVFLLEKRQIARPPAREFKWKLRISLSHPHQRKKSLSCSSRAFFCCVFFSRFVQHSILCNADSQTISSHEIESRASERASRTYF